MTTGRKDSCRLASVIPYRIGEAGLEFCLITTRRSRRWGFPKGHIAPKQDATDAALQEAQEEAGLSGRIAGELLGQYSYKKRGRKQSVVVMLMEVESSEDDWKESAERERCWASPERASGMLDRSNLLQLLQTAIERLSTASDDRRS